MAVFRFSYGNKHHCVRVGFGSRPLVYAVYMYDREESLPSVHGAFFRLFGDDPIVCDWWDERQV